MFLVGAFLLAQLLATVIAVYAKWNFARVRGIGWGWAGAIWVYSLATYLPLDLIKFAIRYGLSGKAWDNLLQNKVLVGLFLSLLKKNASFFLRRRRSRRRRITGKGRERPNGLWRRGHCTDFSPLNRRPCSATRTATASSPRSLSRPRGAPKLPGQHSLICFFFASDLAFFWYFLFYFSNLGFLWVLSFTFVQIWLFVGVFIFFFIFWVFSDIFFSILRFGFFMGIF